MHLRSLDSSIATFDSVEPRDRMFLEMLRAFRRSGGLAIEDDVLESITSRKGVLAPCACNETLLCFEWRNRLWLPRFQFRAGSLEILPDPARVIGELSSVFDGWEMAEWFASSNLWLGGARPVDLLELAPSDVLGAARADRFVAAG
jgi:hypothetical protein